MLLIERLEREWLADRTALVTAAYMSGSDVTPPSFDETVEEFDAGLLAVPEPVSARDRSNRAFLHMIGGGA